MPPRVLIVEDESLISMLLAREFRRLGCDIVGPCASGEEALELDERLNPDLVLMDIRLAGKLDGIETAARMLGRRRVPIAFSSAYPSNEVGEAVKRLDTLPFLPKPVSRQQLMELLGMLPG